MFIVIFYVLQFSQACDIPTGLVEGFQGRFRSCVGARTHAPIGDTEFIPGLSDDDISQFNPEFIARLNIPVSDMDRSSPKAVPKVMSMHERTTKWEKLSRSIAHSEPSVLSSMESDVLGEFTNIDISSGSSMKPSTSNAFSEVSSPARSSSPANSLRRSTSIIIVKPNETFLEAAAEVAAEFSQKEMSAAESLAELPRRRRHAAEFIPRVTRRRTCDLSTSSTNDSAFERPTYIENTFRYEMNRLQRAEKQFIISKMMGEQLEKILVNKGELFEVYFLMFKIKMALDLGLINQRQAFFLEDLHAKYVAHPIDENRNDVDAQLLLMKIESARTNDFIRDDEKVTRLRMLVKSKCYDTCYHELSKVYFLHNKIREHFRQTWPNWSQYDWSKKLPTELFSMVKDPDKMQWLKTSEGAPARYLPLRKR